MNPELFLPIVLESIERLRIDGITRENLRDNDGGHHFWGFGLWFRSRFCHPADAPLHGFHPDPDAVSSFFRRLILDHWDASESEWRQVLEASRIPRLIDDFPKASKLIGCPDDEL